MNASKESPRERLRRAEAASLEEVEWFYTVAEAGIPKPGEATAAERGAARKIQGWLGQIATFHVGALCLRFTPRVWPRALAADCGPWASLVVRLECAAHPSDVYVETDALEAAAVKRLEKMLAGDAESRVGFVRLERRAMRHVDAAIKAYVRVRGLEPSVLPKAEEAL